MNDKKPPAPRSPRQLPETLKGAAHRDRRNAKSRLLEELRTRPQPSLPLVKCNRHDRRTWPSRESPAIQAGISWSLEVTRCQMPCLMPGRKTGRIGGSN
jgi:hypothetical protein